MSSLRLALVISAVGLVYLPSLAGANPRALPFTYTTDTLQPGQVEIEQFVDLTPVKALDGNANPVTILDSQVQTEIEVGLADRLELGLYFTFSPASLSSPELGVPQMLEGDGIKQRLRYIFADPGAWPIDVGVYGEVSENEREIEFEGKLLLQRRFDRLRVAVNVTGEYETYFDHQRDWVIDPSAGATYEITPKFHIGIDSWMRGEYPQHPKPVTRPFALGPEAYVGPAVMMNFGKLWWSVGAYARVTDTSHDLVAGVNEVYGPVWFRSMIGYNL